MRDKFDKQMDMINKLRDNFEKQDAVNMFIQIPISFVGNERQLLIYALYEVVNYHSKIQGVMDMFNKVNQNIADFVN